MNAPRGSEFKHDVAFSFLGQDEALAVQLNRLLSGRVSTFLYSDAERQVSLAGRDGAERFTRVFGHESRIVVVLYRSGWGDKGFTAIEATAIRNRAFENGFDFTSFIPLDEPPVVPQWLPRTRLWHGLKQWGVEGTAAAIELRLQEAGVTPKEETVAEVAARHLSHVKRVTERTTFLTSPNGLAAALQEFEALCRQVVIVADQTQGVVRGSGLNGGIGASLAGGERLMHFVFDREYFNSLQGSQLRIVEYDGRSARRSAIDRDFNATTEYVFDIDLDGVRGWRKKEGPRARILTTGRLVDDILKGFMERIAADVR